VLEGLTDWRTTFLIWSGLSALVFVCVAFLVPSLPSNNAVSVREVFALPLRNPQLRVVLIMVIFFVLGHFGAYTYVRPVLEGGQGATAVLITAVLMIFGLGGAVGNFVAGRTVNRSVEGSFVIGCAGILLSLLLLIMIGDQLLGSVVAMALWGVSFGVVQLSQVTMTLAAAPDTFEAAMSLNTMAYNTSIALGALFGGLVVDNLGVTNVVWFGMALIGISLALRVAVSRLAPRTARVV
jgi:predicted MFS family arabinose efflux permease